MTQDFGGSPVRPKKRKEAVRHVRTYLLVGPPAGLMTLMLLMTMSAGLAGEGVGPALPLLVVGLPLSYVVGGAPALLTGFATLALRGWPKPAHVLGAVVAGAVVSASTGGLFLQLIRSDAASVGFFLVMSLIGAVAALACALMTSRRPKSGRADVAAVFE